MKTERVAFHYLGQVSFLAGRSRTVRKQWVPGVLEADIPVLDGGDVRPVASGAFRSMFGMGQSVLDCLAHDGVPMSPFRSESTGRATLDDFREGALAPTRNPFYLFQDDEPWPRESGKPLPPDVRTILSDGRAGSEARIRALAAGLAVHGGIVYAVGREPVIQLVPHGPMGLAYTVSCDGKPMRGYAFRIDREEAAAAAFARATQTGGYKSEIAPREDPFTVSDPGALRFREDVHNAGVAANYALRHLGDNLAWMPTDLIPMLHRLAVARDGLEDGTSEPADVDAILVECEAARERIPARLVQLKHVLAIGRDMIAMSIPSDLKARIDEDDAQALSAMTPG